VTSGWGLKHLPLFWDSYITGREALSNGVRLRKPMWSWWATMLAQVPPIPDHIDPNRFTPI
jgi:hypothetical protein